MAAFSAPRTAARVTPAALRASLRRRGVLDLSVFVACFATALALSSLFDHGALGWRAAVYVVLLMAPAAILHRLPAQRCPACRTELEHMSFFDDEGRELGTTGCPACEVEIE
jgi:hypothetical protein